MKAPPQHWPDWKKAIEQISVTLLIPHGRSGSMLVQSLLDQHPQAISLYDYHFRYDYRADSGSPEESARSFARDHQNLFVVAKSYFGIEAYNSKSSEYLSRVREIEPSAMEALLLEAFSALGYVGTIPRRDFFILFHLAFAALTGRAVSAARNILFHLHGHAPASIEPLLADFPDLKFLPTIRDPRQSLLSVLERQQRLHPKDDMRIYLALLIENNLEGFEGLKSLSQRVPTLCVDLHRLHERQEGLVREIARFMGIDFTPSLIQSTVAGQAWMGNNSALTPISGLDRSRAVYDFATKLSHEHLAAIEYFFDGAISDHGYSPRTTHWEKSQVRSYFSRGSLLRALRAHGMSEIRSAISGATGAHWARAARALRRALRFGSYQNTRMMGRFARRLY